MTNLFLPVYNNLEKELIKLSESIFFDDKQSDVYSLKVAELLIRTVIEIETLSKKLYFDNQGVKKLKPDGTEDFLYFDTDCINHLENLWLLSKKEVQVSAPNFYFLNKANKILTPLYKANKRGSSSSNWAKAYQAVKHDRSENIGKATIRNLISAMAALYLLNIYNRTPDDVKSETQNEDLSFNSKIFSIQKQKIMKVDYDSKELPKVDDNVVCIEKYTDETYKDILIAVEEDKKIYFKTFGAHPKVKSFFKKNPTYVMDNKTLTAICLEIGGKELLAQILRSSNKVARLLNSTETEIVLNKNQQVYDV